MDKITHGHPLSKSEDILQSNIETLKRLFPTIVKEGKIDMEELKALLSDEVEKGDEYYRFTWAGKSEARREANKPSTGTLRPDKESSKNWETTQNIFIEGDNLEVLKLLQKSYAGKIKMIYIDPPYNTGKDFVYKDNYSDNLGNYLELTGQIDEEGKKISTNTERDGRYHSNWLNMMYPRLKLARTLLKEDGVIFISIDDNESSNLRKLCDEIFGEMNFIADLTVVNNLKGRNDKRYIATANERLFMYVKTDLYEECGLRMSEMQVEEFDLEDEIGKYRELGLRKRGGADTRKLRPNMYFPFWVNPDDGTVAVEKSETHHIEVLPTKSNGEDGCWRWGFDTAKLRLKSLFGRSVGNNGKWDIFEKDYLSSDGELRRIKPKSVLSGTNYSTDRATKEYRALLPEVNFTSPKSVAMLRDLIEYAVPKSSNEFMLDFFAGSGTSAQALMEANLDGGNRRFICVQLNVESGDSKFPKISDITQERIKRGSEKIESEIKQGIKSKSIELDLDNSNELPESPQKILESIDLGFKCFKLDSSNINTWDGNPENIEQTLLNSTSNIKIDRTEDDVLYEVLLKYGLDLTIPIEEKTISNCKVYSVGHGVLFICLADTIYSQVAEGIGKWKEELKPVSCRVLFKDSGFPDDAAKTNSTQILKRFGITEINSL